MHDILAVKEILMIGWQINKVHSCSFLNIKCSLRILNVMIYNQ